MDRHGAIEARVTMLPGVSHYLEANRPRVTSFAAQGSNPGLLPMYREFTMDIDPSEFIG